MSNNRLVIEINAYVAGRKKPIIVRYDLENLTEEQVGKLMIYLTDPIKQYDIPATTGAYPTIDMPTDAGDYTTTDGVKHTVV